MTAHRRRGRIGRTGWLAVAALAACLLLAGGFAQFLAATRAGGPDGAAGPPPRADAIVALTGGAERVATALRLLADGRGRLLLVSGVGGEAGFTALARQAGADPALRSRVTLGRAAASTRGNALETAAWARAHGMGSLLVVTAWYHMPRALAELARALPEIRLYPVPVRPPALGDAATVRLLAGEYAKWLAAEAGLSALASRGADAVATASPRPPSGPGQENERQEGERIVRLGQ